VLQRPVFSEEHTKMDLFVVNGASGSAERRPVELGLGSTDRVQVLGGLSEGDSVIVSDISRFAGKQTIDLSE
jgi:HlyD family secretion protein